MSAYGIPTTWKVPNSKGLLPRWIKRQPCLSLWQKISRAIEQECDQTKKGLSDDSIPPLVDRGCNSSFDEDSSDEGPPPLFIKRCESDSSGDEDEDSCPILPDQSRRYCSSSDEDDSDEESVPPHFALSVNQIVPIRKDLIWMHTFHRIKVTMPKKLNNK
jgi:hypothetical protein